MALSTENLSIAGLISKPAGLISKPDPVHIRLTQYILAAEFSGKNIFPPLSENQLKKLPADQLLVDHSHLSNNGHLEVDPKLLRAVGTYLAAEFNGLCEEHSIPVTHARDGLSMQFAQLLTVLAKLA